MVFNFFQFIWHRYGATKYTKILTKEIKHLK